MSKSIRWPLLWSIGQSSWLQIQKSGFDSWRYQIFWEVVVLKRRPLSLVSTIGELLGRKSSGSGVENRNYGRRDPSCWSRGNLYPQKLAPTLPTSGGRSVGIVRSRTEATEFVFVCKSMTCMNKLNYGGIKTIFVAIWLTTRSGYFSPLSLSHVL
jgi:hypothetical protein